MNFNQSLKMSIVIFRTSFRSLQSIDSINQPQNLEEALRLYFYLIEKTHEFS